MMRNDDELDVELDAGLDGSDMSDSDDACPDVGDALQARRVIMSLLRCRHCLEGFRDRAYPGSR